MSTLRVKRASLEFYMLLLPIVFVVNHHDSRRVIHSPAWPRDLSGLNSKHKDKGFMLSDGAGSSGKTLAGCLRFMDIRRPKICLPSP